MLYTVEDVLNLCEYINCRIVDFWGHEIKIGDNYKEIYEKYVEHIEARVNEIWIFTFVNSGIVKENLRRV